MVDSKSQIKFVYPTLNVSFYVPYQPHLVTLFFPYKVIEAINGEKKNQTHNILKLVEVEHTIKHIWVGNFLQPTIWIKILPLWGEKL